MQESIESRKKNDVLKGWEKGKKKERTTCNKNKRKKKSRKVKAGEKPSGGRRKIAHKKYRTNTLRNHQELATWGE